MKASGIGSLLKGLLYHLVGAAEQRQRDRQAKRLRGLEIDDQFDFGRLLDREACWFLTFEHTGRIATNKAKRIGQAATVAHETAGRRKGAQKINGRNSVASGQRNDLIALIK